LCVATAHLECCCRHRRARCCSALPTPSVPASRRRVCARVPASVLPTCCLRRCRLRACSSAPRAPCSRVREDAAACLPLSPDALLPRRPRPQIGTSFTSTTCPSGAWWAS
jgi:hypothetical protein